MCNVAGAWDLGQGNHTKVIIRDFTLLFGAVIYFLTVSAGIVSSP